MTAVIETKEVIVALNEVIVVIAKLLKDGFQVSDVTDLAKSVFMDEEMKAVLKKAYENISVCKDEIKEIDIMEIVELGTVQLQYIPKILEALKK